MSKCQQETPQVQRVWGHNESPPRPTKSVTREKETRKTSLDDLPVAQWADQPSLSNRRNASSTLAAIPPAINGTSTRLSEALRSHVVPQLDLSPAIITARLRRGVVEHGLLSLCPGTLRGRDSGGYPPGNDPLFPAGEERRHGAPGRMRAGLGDG